MSNFHRLIASVREALENSAAEPHNGVADSTTPVPTTEAARRVELALKFARELQPLGGDFLGTLTPKEAVARVLEIAAGMKARTVAVGAGIVSDSASIAAALERAGVSVIRPAATADDSARIELRGGFAGCDLAVVEADYAIAATGTLAMVATPERPASITLVPPVNVVLVSADRILPDLASVLDAIGPATIAAHRLALVTGPSRTADIEKRIVRGVHGPRELYVAALWQE
jgi:L-lactate dehydrogenase complex protein LldG